MKIKITPDNKAKIDAALNESNGGAVTHTFTTYAEIERLSKNAEDRLSSLLPTKKSWSGAEWMKTSGGSVPNAYKYPRNVTSVKITRCASGWFLTGVSSRQMYGDAPSGRLFLTVEQYALAVEKLRGKYSVK